MFGYVVPYRPELKIKDDEIFRAYYCGICRSIDRENGIIPRAALNYDIVFLGLMLSSLEKNGMKIDKKGCITHPLKGRKYIYGDGALDYAANIGTILAYFNLADDWEDEKSFKGLMGSLAFKRGSVKAREKYEEKYRKIESLLKKIKTLEEEKCGILDEIADVFAKIMEEIADYEGIEDEKTKRAFKWLAYNLGRWIYILDAFDDLEEDFKEGSYNPIIFGMMNEDENISEFRERIRERIEFTLTSSLAAIASSYELLPVEKNKAIIENIIYIGMRRKMESILDRRDKDEESLQSVKSEA